MRRALALLPLLCSSPSIARPLPAGTEHIVTRDTLRLSLWERRPSGTSPGYEADASKVVVLLHGATWSGRPDFDLQVQDYSLMEALARAGYDAFALDVHGYGGSQAATAADDYASADQAVKDVAAALAHIRELRGARSVNLFGWSWGAHVAGLYAAAHPEQVNRLVLYGFFPAASANRRGQPERLPPARFHANSYAATQSDFIDGEFDPEVARRFGTEALRACPQSPNGVWLDFANRMPLFTPAQLRVPTLLIYGIYDLQSPGRRAQKSPEELLRAEARCHDFFLHVNAPDRRFVVIPGGGHAVHLERGHRAFQRAVIDFLGAGPLPTPHKAPPAPRRTSPPDGGAQDGGAGEVPDGGTGEAPRGDGGLRG